MVEVTPINSAAQSVNRAAEPRQASQSLGQDDFLKLMISQLKNQDPFKPMENGEFLGQMAQFSTVAGVQELKDEFAQFSASMGANQMLSASSLIGRDALLQLDQVPGRDKPWQGEVVLPQSGHVNVLIRDGSGAVVHSLDFGQQAAGPFRFTTPVLPGPADYRIDAQLGGAQSGQQLPVSMAGQILGVGPGEDGSGALAIEIESLGSLPFDAIRRVQQETI